MRYALLGDVHANLPALETVLEAIGKEEKVDAIFQAGDIVGYGAQPRECIQLLRTSGCRAVYGNHEAAVLGLLSEEYFNPYAKEAVRWTRTVLGTAELEYLKKLPILDRHPDFALVHGTIHSPEMFHYMMSIPEAEKSLAILDRPVGFVAHSHVPVAFFGGPTISYSLESTIPVARNGRTLVNVGSVGQPRDEDPRAAYAIYDTDRQTVWIRRVEYDVERAAQAILDAGLPKVLAERLHLGR